MSLRLMSSVSYVGLTAANVFFEKVDKPLVQPEKLETEDDFISHLDTIGVLSASIRSSLENIKYLQSFHDQNQLATEVNQYLSENNSSLGLRIRKWPANHQDKNGHELSVQNGDKTQLAIIRLCDRKQQAEGYAFGPKITTVCESYNSQSNAHAGEIAEVTEMASGNAFKMPQRRISMISVGSLSSPKCYEKDVDYVNENYSFQSFFGGSNSSLSSDSSVSSPSGSVHSLDNDNVRSASSTPYSDSDTEIQDQFWDMSPMNSANPWSQEKDQETHSETSVEPVMDNRELTVDLISPLPYVDNDNDNDNDIDSEDESIFNPASPVSAVVQSPVHAVSVEQTQCYDASEPDSISVTTGESHSSSESVALVDEGQRQDYSDINTDDVLLMLSTPTLAELRTNPFFPSTDEFQKENVATTHHSEPASPNVQMHNMATRSAPVSPKNGLYNPTPHIQFDRQCQKETNFGSELIYNVNSALSNVPAANYDMTETHLFQSYLPPLMVSQHQSTQQINHSENGLSNRNFSMHFLNQNPYLIDGMIDYLDRSIVSKMNELSFCLAVKGPNEIRLLRELVELRRKDEMVKKLRTDRVKLQQPQPLNVFQPMVTPMNMPIHNSGYQSEYLAPFQPDANRQMYVPQMPCNPYERVAPSYPPAQYLTTQQWHYERNVSIHPAHQNRPVSTCQPVRVLTESNDSINIVENNNFDTV
ncbi:MAG: hypothetical protein HAW66_08610, partial [Shewanella sp.]|nr:hypothetical protein [Shewanella sp.]